MMLRIEIALRIYHRCFYFLLDLLIFFNQYTRFIQGWLPIYYLNQISTTMIQEKFQNILNGRPEDLTSQEVVDFGVHCAGQNLSLDKLISISTSLFKKNKANCYEFLQFIEKHEITRPNYRDFIHQPNKIKIYNSLAALTLAKALRESEREMIDKTLNESRKYLNSSENVKNTMERSIILLRGFLLYYSGELGKANNIFSKAYDDLGSENKGNLPVPALLGLAEICFVKKSYAKSLEYYKKAMMAKKSLPVSARLGMGYCFYELQKYELAEICFRKILKLNPSCASAYMGLAAIRYKDNDYDGYFNNLRMAYKLDPQDPCVLLHLSEHLFFSGENAKTLRLCERGLCTIEKMPKFLKCDENTRNDYEIYKARFNNLIAQIHHMNEDYELALKYYQEAKGKGLNYNDLSLAQVYIHLNMQPEALEIYQSIFKNANPKQSKLIGDHYKTLAYLQVRVNPKNMLNNPNYYYKEALKFQKNHYETLIDYSFYLSEISNKQKTLKTLLHAKEVLDNNKLQLNPELLNNIGAYYLQLNQKNEAYEIMKEALAKLQELPTTNLAEELRYNSLYLVCNFNMAFAQQKLNYFQSAINRLEEMIEKNKYYLDAYSKLAEIKFKGLGNKTEAMDILEQAISLVENSENPTKLAESLIIHKVYLLKAHFLHLDFRNGQSREVLRKSIKRKDKYEYFYEICLGYENTIKKNLEPGLVKQFLRPNIKYNWSVCQSQSQKNNVYFFEILVILLLTDNKIPPEEAGLYFNQLRVAEFQFPQILFNIGIFQMKNKDYENALFSFNRYQEKNKCNKVSQYIALTQFLAGKFNDSLKTLKKKILLEPHNIKCRFQYAYVMEKWVQKLYEEENNFDDLKKTEFYLTMCRQLYTKLSKAQPLDYIKPYDNPDMKQKIKIEISKIRGMSEDRRRFVQSQLDYYAKKKDDIKAKQEKIKEEENRKLQELLAAKKTKELLEKIEGEMDEEDEEQEKIRRRREKLAQMSRVQSQIALKAWGEIEEKHKQEQQDKKNKKSQGKREKKPKKLQPLEKIEDEQQSEEQFNDEGSYRDEEEEVSSEKKKKKEKKKKSKKNRIKDKKKKKKERNSDDDGSQSENIGLSEESEENLEDELDDDPQPRKERKKNREEEDDDLGIDYDKYLVND